MRIYFITIIGLFLSFFPSFTEAKTMDIVLQLRWHHQFQFAGYYAAQAKGYYHDAGLNVIIKEGSLSVDTVTEVIEERADFGVTNSEILLKRLQGKPVVITAAIFQHSPLVLLTRQDTGVSNPQQLIGKKVKLTRQSRDIELHAMFENEGVSLDSLNLISGSAGKKDYLNSEIDAVSAYLTNETYYMQKAGVPYTVIKPANYGIDFYGDCLFTSSKQVRINQQVVEAFNKASLKGWRYAMRNPEEIADLIINTYQSQKSKDHLLFEAMVMKELIVPDLVEIGHINHGRWERIADIFVEHGFVDSDYSLDGFIFGPNPSKDYERLKWTTRGLLLIIFLVVFTAILLYIFNRRLQKEVKERKRSEKAYRDSEERFKLLINNADMLISIFNENGAAILINNTFAKYFKKPPDYFFAKSMYDFFDHETVNQYLFRIKDVITTLEHRTYEDEIEFPIGVRCLQTSVQPMIDTNGKAYAVQVISSDITAHKEMESQLQASEEQYRAVSEITSDYAYAYDLLQDGLLEIRWITGAIKEITGYELDEIKSFDKGWISLVHPEDISIPEFQTEQLKSGESSVVEYRIIKKDNSICWLRDQARINSCKCGMDDCLFRIYGAVQDITEEKRAKEALQIAYYDLEQRVEKRTEEFKEINSKLRDEIRIREEIEQKLTYAKRHAEQANEAKSEFLANVSHELRTPMHHILNYSQYGITKFNTVSQDRLLHYFKQIRKTGDRLMTFLNALLDLSSLETRNTNYDMGKVDIFEMIQERVAELDTSLEKKELKIRLKRTDIDTQLICDEHKINQVLQNVLTNAIKFTPEKKEISIYFDPSVLYISDETGKSLVVSALSVSVWDQGIGIPERELEAVFDKFVQSSKTRTGAGGTGLGLAISKEIVEAHKGIIYAENNTDGGATFTFTLPYEQAAIVTADSEMVVEQERN